jgi:hypothetical protein
MNYLIYVCNALDDLTKIDREIKTDSSACTRKVFLNTQNLKSKNISPIILSLGRGKSNYSFKYYKSKVSRINGVPIIYAPFFSFKIISKIVSFLWPLVLMLRFKKKIGNKVFLFWNRTPAYIPILIVSKILRFRNVLDLEDGAFYLKFSPLNNLKVYMMNKIYDSFCSHALVTCNELKKNLKIKNVMCHYGFFEETVRNIKFIHTEKINFHFGGTVSEITGANQLIKSIKILKKNNSKWLQKINFIITGNGDLINDFKLLSNCNIFPTVKVYDQLSYIDYVKVLRSCRVGLALKPKTGNLANTTFPSKVIEIANNGLLLLSTDISDVKQIFKNGAVYTNSNIHDFAKLIKWIVFNFDKAKEIANIGSNNVKSLCTPEKIKMKLSNFLFY